MTNSEEDLVPLRQVWNEAQLAKDKDPEAFIRAATSFADAMVFIRQFDVAVEVLESFGSQMPNFARTWLYLATESGDPRALKWARDLSSGLSEQDQPPFYVKLYELTGKDEDARNALKALADRKDKRSGWFLAQLIVAHVKWRKVKEAKDLALLLEEDDHRVWAWTGIARATGELSPLRVLLKRLDDLKIGSVKSLAVAFREAGRREEFEAALDLSSSWQRKCLGYSILARSRTEDDRTFDLLDKAELVLTSAQLCGGVGEGETLGALVYAQAMHRRLTEAATTASVIKEREKRCLALLLLHALTEGQPVPDFIASRL